MSNNYCYFCDRVKTALKLVYEDSLCFVLKDNFPLSEGHTLIVPKEHIANIFEVDEITYQHLFNQVKIFSHKLKDEDSNILGFNIGVNQGSVAGQTVMHVHIHLIPRRLGDVEDPRGGVRWIFPGKAKYWD